MKLRQPCWSSVLCLLARVGKCSRTSERTPGDQMQDKGSPVGVAPGRQAAAGREMKRRGSVKGTEGASGYAPDRSTTGSKSGRDEHHNEVEINLVVDGSHMILDRPSRGNLFFLRSGFDIRCEPRASGRLFGLLPRARENRYGQNCLVAAGHHRF